MASTFHQQQLASAETLVESAADLIGDAVVMMQDAEDSQVAQDLSYLSEVVLLELEKLRKRRLASEAASMGEVGQC